MTLSIDTNESRRDLVSPDQAERLRDRLDNDDSRYSFSSYKTVDYRATLARLLASENITIEHRADAPTAAFDIKNRVLILPTWKDISKEVYDLLVLHEVGHALYTPLDGWHDAVTSEGPEFKSFLNVIEDARIEKKIKRKYPGGRKSFIEGYGDLLDRDFFGLKDRDINTFGFIDRINMHFKGGALLDIEFTDAEKVWVARIAKAETWSEVEKIARELWDLASEAAETDTDYPIDVNPGDWGDDDDSDDGEGFGAGDEEDEDESGNGENPFGDDADGESDTDGESASGNSSPDEDADDSGDGDSGDGDETSEETDKDNKGSGGSGNDDDDDSSDSDSDDAADDSGDGDMAGHGGNGKGESGGKPFSETDKAWRDNEDALVDHEADEVTYVSLADDAAYNLDGIIISHDEIWAKIMRAQVKGAPDRGGERGRMTAEALANAKSDLSKFKNANSKVINYLAKEFEMKKAAEASARAATSRTGVIDTNRLHSYKWNDDIFKKITTIPDGKNHGLVLFMDWSGSMQSNMFGSIEQILTIMLFCKKVNIPMDVYAFTDGARSSYYRDEGDSETTLPPKMNESRIRIGDYDLTGDNFNLMHLGSSHVKTSKYNEMLLGLIMLRGHFNHSGRHQASVEGVNYFPMPNMLNLHGTPLCEAIATAIPIVNKFRVDHKLQIVNTVFLTDGEGYGLRDVRKSDGSTSSPKRGNVVLRDRKTHKEVSTNGYTEMETLMDMFRLKTGTKIVNFYITAPHSSSFKREWLRATTGSNRNYEDDRRPENEAWKTANADGGIVIEDARHGWDALYYVLGGSSMVIRDEGLDKDLIGAKKATLKKAFAKAATGKLRNRVLLRNFIALIAE